MVAGRFGQGPNKYPEEMKDAALFQTTAEEYHAAMTLLASRIMQVLAKTLGIADDFFADYAHRPIATLRLLHYPPQAPDAPASERGEFLVLLHGAWRMAHGAS